MPGSTATRSATSLFGENTIGDETDADEIFAKLMGDQVKPRLEFIEKNALDVTWLDI